MQIKSKQSQWLILIGAILILLFAIFLLKRVETKDGVNTGGNGCKRGGCSGQLCVKESEKDTVSTCEWSEEYGCLQKAVCEKQANGECGFTPTKESIECMARFAPALEEQKTTK